MHSENTFRPFGTAHLIIMFLTIALPFVLAEMVRRTNSRRTERIIAFALGGLLLLNYIVYEIYVRLQGPVHWWEALPLQLCDWAMFVIIVAMWTGRRHWFEVAYFWGIGGTLQAIITPNLKYGFPDLRFISFFVAHSAIIIGIIFLMLVHKYRPWPASIVRTFVWTEVYFVVAFTVDLVTVVNYGFLLHKPEAFSLLSLLSDWRPLYLLQMHGVALLFYLILYVPFAIWDIARSRATREMPPVARR
jgi:hypothetical integral membrane protein (TIGR02206 family)